MAHRQHDLLPGLALSEAVRPSRPRETRLQSAGRAIERPNHVWCADITCIPGRRGFLYLVAIMDWASRRFSTSGRPPHAS